MFHKDFPNAEIRLLLEKLHEHKDHQEAYFRCALLISLLFAGLAATKWKRPFPNHFLHAALPSLAAALVVTDL